jgi:ketosteroid isomerase-like protein
MRDLIPPAVARNPVEAIEIVSLAISDGDLEAALAQYEDEAVLRPWQSDAAGGEVSALGDGGSRSAAAWLRDVMDLRLPLVVRVLAVVPAGDQALVLAERHISGAGPDCERVELTGSGAAIVRRHPGGGWRIAAEAWCLAGIGGPDGRHTPDGPGAADSANTAELPDPADRFPSDSP